MVDKGVTIVAQLFFKAIFTYWWGERELESVFLLTLILIFVFTIFKNPNKSAVLDFVLMLSAILVVHLQNVLAGICM